MSMTKGLILNYGQAMKLGAIEDKIELYVRLNYPDKSYGTPNNILGRAGREFSKTTWGKLIKLAKNDEGLQSFVNEFNVELLKVKESLK
ncbi:MAG: hypothetical protein ACK5EG_06930 [Chitinophagaceae bacterium]|jgi:hypothetical protein